uniref:Ig-like domain-containing protein n=1 Tax=Sinocyclocheilus rhinocerous TaxID=307959 RepID=A0A673JAK7_9TELE
GELQMVEVVKGSTAQLECEVTGTAPFEVTWFKNKNPVSSDKKYSIVSKETVAYLEIKSFESADVADYQCCISNDVGRITSKAVAKLKDPPLFVKKVENTTAVLGSAVKLQGTLKGSAPLTVQWFKDSEIVRDDDPNITTTFENNIAILAIANVAINHGGKYTCQAENEAGKQKCEATVSVQEPARFVEKPPSISVTAGDSATLECKVSGSPDLKVKWFRDGKEITGSRKCKISFKDNVAALKILSTSDAGVFTCHATNAAGHSETSGTVSVKEPPVFSLKPQNQDVIPGTTVVLTAAFTGTAPFIIKWFREDKEMLTGGTCFIKKEANSSSLELHSVKPSQSAKYTCQVSNDAGKVSCTAALFVKEPPKFVMKLDSTKLALNGSLATLECKVTGSPEISIRWYKNETEISSNDKYQMTFIDSVAKLQISNCCVEDSGDYICQASSEARSDTCSCLVTLECEVTGTAPFEVTWFKNKNPVSSDKKYSIVSKETVAYLEIKSFESADVADYQCCISNDVGRITSKAVAKLKGWYNQFQWPKLFFLLTFY